MAECLHIAQDTGSGRRKAGDRLEEGVSEDRDVFGDHQRDRSQNTEYDPAESDNDKSLSCVVRLVPEFDRSDRFSDGKIYYSQYDIHNGLLLPVTESAQSREYQKRADELRDDAEDLSDNVIIHVYASRPLSQYVLNVAESKLGGDDNNAVTHMDAGVSVGDNDPAAAADACDKDIGLHFQFGEGDSHHG